MDSKLRGLGHQQLHYSSRLGEPVNWLIFCSTQLAGSLVMQLKIGLLCGQQGIYAQAWYFAEIAGRLVSAAFSLRSRASQMVSLAREF